MSKEDFSQYGKDFQESLCHLMLIDRPFADQMYEVIDINFLELKSAGFTILIESLKRLITPLLTYEFMISGNNVTNQILPLDN
mgnify:CR=1 FL=1